MIADLRPTLTGPSVALRPLRADDRDALYAVASDPLVWAVHPAHDRHEARAFDAFFAEALAAGGGLVILDRADRRIIGSSRYSFERAEPGEVEIGWTFLARAYWGGATNREVKRLMLAHAFSFAERVIFLVGEGNGRSRRAMEKIGGRLTNRTFPAMMAGKLQLHVIYAIDAAGFAAGPLAARE